MLSHGRSMLYAEFLGKRMEARMGLSMVELVETIGKTVIEKGQVCGTTTCAQHIAGLTGHITLVVGTTVYQAELTLRRKSPPGPCDK